MNTTVSLNNGRSVTLRDTRDLTNREQREAIVALSNIDKIPGAEDNIARFELEARSTILPFLIVSWTLTNPDGSPKATPSADPNALEDVTNGDLRTMWDAVKENLQYLNPSFEPTVESVETDPKAPASTESAQPSDGQSGTTGATVTEVPVPTSAS